MREAALDWTLAIIVWIVCGIASLLIAQSRGAANAGSWFVLGVLLGPIGVILALIGVKSAGGGTLPGGGTVPVGNVADELSKLVTLRNAGELSQAEFDQQRARLIGPAAPNEVAGWQQRVAPLPPTSGATGFTGVAPGTVAPASGPRTAERVIIALIVLAVLGGGALLFTRMRVDQTLVDVASALPTARPTVFVAAAPAPVYGGSGIITFGTAYDPDTLLISKPTSRFKRTYPEIAWSAELTRGAGSTTMTWIIASQSASGTEVTLLNQEQTVSNPDFDLLANVADLAFLVDNKAGTYVMRYIESGEVLAEGTFTLVK